MSEKKVKLKGRIITPLRLIEDGEVCFSGGIIEYCGTHKNDDMLYDEVVDYGDRYVSPGFIDIHAHGGGGHDFMDGTLEAFLGAARMHASHGTAVLLPTTLTCPDEELFEAFDIFRRVRETENDGAFLAGFHLEGPYLSETQKGAQDAAFIKAPEKSHYTRILEAGGEYIKRWTIAPEIHGAMELGRELVRRGIKPSIGHSDAVYETALEAYENGYHCMTHFYSGMSTLVRDRGYRIPGLIETGYMFDGFDVEVICDGLHLPPVILKHIYEHFGPNRIALITDAMRGAGQGEGESILGSLKSGMKVTVEDGIAKLPDLSGFAGSVATADRLVRTVLCHTGASLIDAVRMMTMTPARIAGLHGKGALIPGYDADFTIFDENINITATIAGGRTVYCV